MRAACSPRSPAPPPSLPPPPQVARNASVCHDATSLQAVHFPYVTITPTACAAPIAVSALTTLASYANHIPLAGHLAALDLPAGFSLMSANVLAVRRAGRAGLALLLRGARWAACLRAGALPALHRWQCPDSQPPASAPAPHPTPPAAHQVQQRDRGRRRQVGLPPRRAGHAARAVRGAPAGESALEGLGAGGRQGGACRPGAGLHCWTSARPPVRSRLCPR